MFTFIIYFLPPPEYTISSTRAKIQFSGHFIHWGIPNIYNRSWRIVGTLYIYELIWINIIRKLEVRQGRNASLRMLIFLSFILGSQHCIKFNVFLNAFNISCFQNTPSIFIWSSIIPLFDIFLLNSYEIILIHLIFTRACIQDPIFVSLSLSTQTERPYPSLCLSA